MISIVISVYITVVVVMTILSMDIVPDNTKAGLELLGCFADKGVRALNGWMITSTFMTPELCRNMCKGKVSIEKILIILSPTQLRGQLQ